MSATTSSKGPADDELAKRLRHLAAVRAVAEIDMARLLPDYLEGKVLINAAFAVALNPQDAQSLATRGKRLAPVREGFSGADPYEIALRYEAGQLSREELVEELTRWEYTPDTLPPHPLDDAVIQGDWKEHVVRAFHDGLLDGETYETIRLAKNQAKGRGA